MSFLHPHVVQIRRPTTVPAAANVGDRGYSAEQGAAHERVVYPSVRCAMQEKSSTKGGVGLPSDGNNGAEWRIIIPRSAGIPADALGHADIVVDKFGHRYFVKRAYFTALQTWQLTCDKLEL